MPRHATCGKGYQVTTLPSEKKRKKSYYESRLTKGYAAPDKYSQAIAILKTLNLQPILLAKVKDVLNLSFTIIAYCLTKNNSIEAWEVFFNGDLIDAHTYKPKDIYENILITHTYYNLANHLAKSPNTPALIAPGVMFKPLVELET